MRGGKGHAKEMRCKGGARQAKRLGHRPAAQPQRMAILPYRTCGRLARSSTVVLYHAAQPYVHLYSYGCCSYMYCRAHSGAEASTAVHAPVYALKVGRNYMDGS